MADVRNSSENGAKKRRELGENSDHLSPLKKIKLDDDEPPVANPNTMEAVRDKNKAMALDLQEKNRRIAFLTHKCESLFRQRAITDAAFRCIQRQWRSLLDDVTTASQVMTLNDAALPEWQEIVATSESLGMLRVPHEAVTVALPEWFTSISKSDEQSDATVKTETGVDGDNADGGEDEAKPTSVVLTEKEKQTEMVLKEEKERATQLVQKLLAAVSTVAQVGAKKLEFKTLVADKRAATEHVLQLQDELEMLQKRMASVESDLEYKEAERHRACREYDRLRAFVEKQATESAAKPGDQEVKEENGDAAGHTEKADTSGKPRSSEKRVTLVEADTKPSVDREQMRKLQEDKNILVHKLKEERQKAESMRSELTRLQALETAWKQEEVRQREEFEATVTRLRDENKQLNESLSLVRREKTDEKQLIQDSWRNQLEKSTDECTKIKGKLDELTTKNAALRDKLASFSTYRDQLSDLKSQHEALRRETSRLKEQLERERAKNGRVQDAEERKEVLELHEQLRLAQQQRDVLRDGSASADRHVLDALEAKNAELTIEVEKLRVDLETATTNQDSFKDENDALVVEIEVLNKDVEATRHSKKKVIKQLEEKRQVARKLQNEVAKEADARAHCAEELATVRLQVSSLKYVHSQQKATLEAAKEAQKAKEQELDDLKKYAKLLENERDNVTTEKIKAQRDTDVAKQMYKAEAAHKQRQVLQDKSRPCDQCESFRKKEADYEKRIAALRASSGSSSSGGDGGNGLADLERFELQDLRKQLKCSVCQDRHKDVIISKCFHMFCKDCVDSNLKSRNRKCPTCKKMYGQDDVKSVWFT